MLQKICASVSGSPTNGHEGQLVNQVSRGQSDYAEFDEDQVNMIPRQTVPSNTSSELSMFEDKSYAVIDYL